MLTTILTFAFLAIVASVIFKVGFKILGFVIKLIGGLIGGVILLPFLILAGIFIIPIAIIGLGLAVVVKLIPIALVGGLIYLIYTAVKDERKVWYR